MNESKTFHSIAFSDCALEHLTERLRRTALAQQRTARGEAGMSLVVKCARDLLTTGPRDLPRWVDTDTHYVVLLDAPEQTIPRLATILRLHKPDRRLHVSPDPGIVKRTVLALSRSTEWEGILDAFMVSDRLCMLLGDMTEREFPQGELPALMDADPSVFENFTIDSAGSFLYWPDLDLHMGPSQMLQAVDPTYLADVEIERYSMENLSQALHDMRVERDLRQTDIPGLSERHVRRLEKERLRLSVDAAEKFARAFGQDLGGFLDELSERVTALRAVHETKA